jgi:FtsP/CotA-like multicopper oxidase with cupredoxin domain
VFRAKPGGTHWYHSHILTQRDQGIVGAMIVRDQKTSNTRKLLRNVVDDPGKTMLAIRDHMEQANAATAAARGSKPAICQPDRSLFALFPIFGNKMNMEAFRINGVKLNDKLPKFTNHLKPIFYVERGKRIRFRILGIMSSNVLRISIDKHKLHVMSADGYLAKPFETDLLVVHIAERYDFIVNTNKDYKAGTVFPIRIETIAVQCNDFATPKMVGYAYLQYTDNETPGKPNLVDHYGNKHRCKVEKCTALNCPFQNYPPEANITCHNVRELRLLNPTPRNQLPQHTGEVVERFFNFGFTQLGPAINGIVNQLPQNIPFVHSGSEEVANECTAEDKKTCKSCAQTVYLKRNSANKAYGTFSPQTMRFVLSSISATSSEEGSTNVITHPVHLHGHSFFVTKIAYPTYDENGAIIAMNPNLTQPNPNCGPAQWTKGERPSDIEVDSRTVRKDMIIVPAGGYVVIEFLADNPGWWFMHCHIDSHSSNGMAIAVSELPSCRTAPQNDKFKVKHSYWLSTVRFLGHEWFNNKCNIKVS